MKRINVLNMSMSVIATFVFNDLAVEITLSSIHDKYFVVPAD